MIPAYPRLSAVRAKIFLKNKKRYDFRWNDHTACGGTMLGGGICSNLKGYTDPRGFIMERLTDGKSRVVGIVEEKDVPKVLRLLRLNADGTVKAPSPS